MLTKFHPVRLMVLLFSLVALSACAPKPAAGTLSLRLAISDAKQDTKSEAILNEFANQVKTLSNGEMSLNLNWDAGSDTQAGFESGVVQLVRDGKADLGLAASRAWDSQGITAFQPLQAPFLIDSDALAAAVATSDISTKMLENLSKSGIVGLTIWPEDLRHPFSTIPDKPILFPADFAGRKVRVTGSLVTEKLIKTLGGTPMRGDGGYEGAESGLRQGGTLSGSPAATANVTFFPKYQVLFANKAAFDKLTAAQQAVLRQAAAAAQNKAIADHPGEAEAAKKWCSDSGTVVLASAEQLAAFEKAAQPVFDWIAQDPQNAQVLAAIRELKAKTPPAPSVAACAAGVAQQISTQAPDTQSWSTGLPPNGTWQVTLTGDELMKLGVSKARSAEWSGIFTNTFKDGVFHTVWQGTEGDQKDKTDACDGTYKLVEDYVSITLTSHCGNEVDNIRWRLDPDGLHLHVISIENGPAVEVTAVLEAKPYQKVETWSAGLPPNGTYQVTLTNDDVIKMGVSKSNAPLWSGIWTHTFKDGVFHNTWQGTEGDAKGQGGTCDGTYKLDGDNVIVTLSGDCDKEVYTLRWRLDPDGLHLHLVSVQNASTAEVTAMLEAKPYQKVADQ